MGVAPLTFALFFLAKDEGGSSCGKSDEALPTFLPGLHLWDHLQLFGQGKSYGSRASV